MSIGFFTRGLGELRIEESALRRRLLWLRVVPPFYALLPVREELLLVFGLGLFRGDRVVLGRAPPDPFVMYGEIRGRFDLVFQPLLQALQDD